MDTPPPRKKEYPVILIAIAAAVIINIALQAITRDTDDDKPAAVHEDPADFGGTANNQNLTAPVAELSPEEIEKQKRVEAAVQILKGIHVPGNREKFQKKIAALSEGMRRDAVETLLPPNPEGRITMKIRPGGYDLSYWLDREWMITIPFDSSGSPRDKEGRLLAYDAPGNKISGEPKLERQVLDTEKFMMLDEKKKRLLTPEETAALMKKQREKERAEFKRKEAARKAAEKKARENEKFDFSDFEGPEAEPAEDPGGHIEEEVPPADE